MMLSTRPVRGMGGWFSDTLMSIGWPGCKGEAAWPVGPVSCEYANGELEPGVNVPVIKSPPQSLPPAAPQTREQMTIWTPSHYEAVATQRALDWRYVQSPSAGDVKKPKEGDGWFDKYKWWILGGGAIFLIGAAGGFAGGQKLR